MADRTIAIRATGLCKRYGNRSVFREISFEVARGECVALTGSNGAGKTTLLRCLASVTRPSAGEIFWFAEPAVNNPAARRLIGVVAHENLLYGHLTLRENLVFSARMYGQCHPARGADRLLGSAGLEADAHRLPGRISQGMRRRLAVLRALVHDPPILLLDEPFSSLDAEGTDWLFALLSDLRRRGRTICFVTHDRAVVQRLAERILHLRSAKLEELEINQWRVFPNSPNAARAA